MNLTVKIHFDQLKFQDKDHYMKVKYKLQIIEIFSKFSVKIL